MACTFLLGSNHGTPGETMQALYVCGRNIDSHFCRHLANFPLGNNLFLSIYVHCIMYIFVQDIYFDFSKGGLNVSISTIKISFNRNCKEKKFYTRTRIRV